MVKSVVTSILLLYFVAHLNGQAPEPPDTVIVLSGRLLLKGLLWRPEGNGAFPSLIFCHGSYETDDPRYDVVRQISVLGPLFARNGYIFLGFFRQGTGLSKGQGENSADLMKKALKEKGQQERNRVQMQLLQTKDMQDVSSGLAFLKHYKKVDTNNIAIIGHSFGGSLSLFVAEHNAGIKAVVAFGAGGYSWNFSPQLQTGLINAVKRIHVPVMFVYAQNDYSVNAANTLDSVMNLVGKQHILKIYPSYGSSSAEGHNMIFLKTDLWEEDVFKFLHQYLRH